MLASINAQNTKFSVTSPLTGLIFHASRGLTNLHIGKSVRDICSIAFEFIIILYLIGRLDSFAVGGKKPAELANMRVPRETIYVYSVIL